MPRDPDLVIAGAGAAGLATGIALARAGMSVSLLGVPQTIRDDGRSAALFASSFAFLDSIGVGAALRARGWPLRAIRIVDVTDALIRAPSTIFRSMEVGEPAFGWNIANAEILRTLIETARALPGLTLEPTLLAGFEPEAGALTVRLTDGRVLQTKLLIGADGQKSAVREQAGIAARIKPYPQVAITARALHARDHDDISTEFHTREGPLTFVPAGEKRSAIVWLMRPEQADRRANLAREALVREIERISGQFLGPLALEGAQGRVPMQKLVAEKLVGPRVALVGEAAHAFPPIGAQGLNLGFRDCEVLVQHIGAAARSGQDFGDRAVLEAYARQRRFDVEARSMGVDLLNTALIGDLLPLDLARAAGLTLFRTVAPLRRLAMRIGGGMPLFGADPLTRPAACSRKSARAGP